MIDSKSIYERKKWLSITGLCNNNCLFCLDADRPDKTHKGKDDIIRQIDEAYEDGFTKLIFSGGDPTIHPDTIELIRYAKCLGFSKIQVITNGRMFASKKFTDRMIAAGLDEVTFSIHGYSKEMHDSLTSVEGSLIQVVRGVYNVKSYPDMIVNTDTCMTGRNFRELPKIIRFIVEKLGIMEVNLMSMVPQGNAWKNRREMLYEFKDVAPFVHEVIEYCKAKGCVLWLSRFPARYLEDYPEYIEDPYKMVDDVRGCGEDVFGDKLLPGCLGGRCKYCSIVSICPALRRINQGFMEDVRKEEGKEMFTITRQNYRNLPRLLNGKKDIIIQFAQPGYSVKGYRESAVMMSEAVPYLKRALKGVKGWELKDIPPCIFLTKNRFFSDFALKQEYVVDGRLDYQKAAEDIACKAKMKRLSCVKCPYGDKCDGFFINYARAFGFDEFRCDEAQEIRINLDCNQKCRFCNTDKDADDVVLDNEDVRRRIADKCSPYLTISGKEPTLHPDLIDFIRQADSRGYSTIELQTNAIRCADNAYASGLADAGLDQAFVSLHAHDAEISDAITRAPGTFDKTLKGIRNLKRSGISVSINIVINSMNYKHLPDIVRFIMDDIGDIRKVILSFVAPVCDAMKDSVIIPRMSEAEPYLKKAMDLLVSRRQDFCLPGRCGMPFCFTQGYWRYSDEFNEGQRWDDSADKMKLSCCSQCSIGSRCNGIWSNYLDIHGDEEFRTRALKGHIEINMGKACNNHCSFCMIPDSSHYRKMASAEDIRKEIDMHKEYSSIGFVGGEPTIHPGLAQLVRHAKASGFSSISIVTNGRKLSDKDYLEGLLDAGVTRFNISTHTHIRDIAEALSGKGSHDERMRGLLNLLMLKRRYDFSISLNFIMAKQSLETLAESIEFFKALGIDDFRLNTIHPEGNALKNMDEVVPRFSDIRKALPSIIDAAGDAHLSFGDMPLCVFGEMGYEDFIHDDHIGEVSSFNDDEKRIIDWDHERVADKAKAAACKGCRHDRRCEGIWKGYLDRYGDEEFGR